MAEKTEPARRVRPEVFYMRRTRLAGGGISEQGSGQALLQPGVKPEPRGGTAPTPTCPTHAVRRTGPSVQAG